MHWTDAPPHTRFAAATLILLASLACADDGKGDGDSDSAATTGGPGDGDPGDGDPGDGDPGNPVLNPVDLAVDCIAGSCMTFVP